MVCLRNISVDTLHKGDSEDDDDNYYYYYYYYHYHHHRISHFSAMLENIHLSWDITINRITLGGLIHSLKSALQLNMCQELQIFAFVYMYLDAS
jgi:hypothetical protein